MAHRPALLVVDMQNGLLSAAHQLDRTVAAIADVRDRARAAGVPVVVLQQWSAMLPQGEYAWEVVPELAPSGEDVVIQKQSADPFIDTGLDERLRALGVTEVIVTGFATEFCVDTAARAALGRGYDVVLVEDGHTTFDRPDVDEYVAADRSIRHHNLIFRTIEFHGRRIRVLAASAVDFREP